LNGELFPLTSPYVTESPTCAPGRYAGAAWTGKAGIIINVRIVNDRSLIRLFLRRTWILEVSFCPDLRPKCIRKMERVSNPESVI